MSPRPSEPTCGARRARLGAGSRRLALGLLAALLASCTSTRPASVSDRDGVLAEFQFIQHGRVLAPLNGVVSLTRSPFSIRYLGQGPEPSVFASTKSRVHKQYRESSAPLSSLVGTGSAVYPSDLFVTGERLSLYDGWSREFERDWGQVYGDGERLAFADLSGQLPSRPRLTMSGRNYANFVSQPDGSRLYEVSRLNGEAVSRTRYRSLYLALFVDDGGDASAYLLEWATVELEFVER